jgi:hypothetical protein
MTHAELHDAARRQPFIPFRVILTTGGDSRHPPSRPYHGRDSVGDHRPHQGREGHGLRPNHHRGFAARRWDRDAAGFFVRDEWSCVKSRY